jgi:hypothetical protein
MRAATAEDYPRLLQAAEQAIAHALQEAPPTPILVLDRLWITLFTLLPPSYQEQWSLRPPTAVCWADLETTLSRLSQREEARESVEWHAGYVAQYAELARIHGCELIRTGEQEEAVSLAQMVAWARGAINGE